MPIPLFPVVSAVAFAFPSPQAAEPTLAQRLDRLCETVEQRRIDLHISGLSLAVVKGDEVVLARGFGLRDREKKLPADAQTLYGIGSTTKAFTSMVCALMAEEGKLSFSERPAAYLPWFKFKDPETDAKATLRDLLSHRTGLTRNDLAWVGTEATQDDLLRSVAGITPFQPFRSAWQYNNCMFLTAGRCAAAVAGKSWDELVQQRLFAPLGMTHSTTTDAAAQAEPMLSGRYDWAAAKNDFAPVDWMTLGNMAPAGSICSTVTDMAQWVRLLLHRGEYGGKRLVADATFDELWSDDSAKVTPNGKPLAPSYGLGWFLHDDDAQAWKDPAGKRHRVIEHGGNVAGYAAEVGLLPDLGLGLVMLSNVSASQLQAGILPIVFDAMAGPWTERKSAADGAPLAEAATKEWLGAWTDGRPYVAGPTTLSRPADHLILSLPVELGRTINEVFTLLWPGADGRAVLREEPDSYVTFQANAKGELESFTLTRRDIARRCTRPPTPKSLPPPEITVDEFCEKRLAATGAAAMTAWKSLRMTGTMSFPHAGVTGSYVLSTTGPGTLRIDFDARPFGHGRLIVAGGKGAFVGHMGSRAAFDPAEIAALLFANPLLESGDWRDHADEVEVTRLTTTSSIGAGLGRLAVEARVTAAGGATTNFYVAPDSNDLIAVEGGTAFPGIPNALPIALLGDYRVVEGVRLPFRREAASPGSGALVLQFTKAEVDVDFPAGFFEIPASPKQ